MLSQLQQAITNATEPKGRLILGISQNSRDLPFLLLLQLPKAICLITTIMIYSCYCDDVSTATS